MFSLWKKFLLSSFLRKQESSAFWIPGCVSLARNNSTIPELSDFWSPPAEPGVYLNANYIHFNPVKCSLVEKAEDYKFSSALAYKMEYGEVFYI